jgi:hypothetical protein
MDAARRWRAVASIAGVLVLLSGAAALTPAGAGAVTTHKCANKTLTLELSNDEGGVRQYPEPIKAITTQGISCAGAYKFLNAFFHNHTTGVEPEHFKCRPGNSKSRRGSYHSSARSPA